MRVKKQNGNSWPPLLLILGKLSIPRECIPCLIKPKSYTQAPTPKNVTGFKRLLTYCCLHNILNTEIVSRAGTRTFIHVTYVYMVPYHMCVCGGSLVAQWLAQCAATPEVGGSNPTRGKKKKKIGVCHLCNIYTIISQLRVQVGLRVPTPTS